jgi:hypothetical protein
MTPRHIALIILAGAATLFTWESISNAALPWHRMTMRSFADSNAAVAAIRAQAPDNGLYFDERGVVAAVAFLPDMKSRETLMTSMMLKHFAMNVVLAAILVLAMAKLPRGTPLQYAGVFGLAGFAISLSTFGANWNWWGYPLGWTAVQVIDRGIGFALMGLAMGYAAHHSMPRSRTDEWGGVRAQGGLPTATRNSSLKR